MLGILLFFLGWILGFLVFSFVILPLVYGVPKAIFWVAKGQIRKGAIWYYIRVFIFSNIFLLAIALLIIYFIPSSQDVLYDSTGFFYGQWVGIGFSLIYALTKKGRSDLDADFWAKMRSKYARNEL
jgi:hypothetical protein